MPHLPLPILKSELPDLACWSRPWRGRPPLPSPSTAAPPSPAPLFQSAIASFLLVGLPGLANIASWAVGRLHGPCRL